MLYETRISSQCTTLIRDPYIKSVHHAWVNTSAQHIRKKRSSYRYRKITNISNFLRHDWTTYQNSSQAFPLFLFKPNFTQPLPINPPIVLVNVMKLLQLNAAELWWSAYTWVPWNKGLTWVPWNKGLTWVPWNKGLTDSKLYVGGALQQLNQYMCVHIPLEIAHICHHR